MRFYQTTIIAVTTALLSGCASTEHVLLADGACVTCLNNPITNKPVNYSSDEFIFTPKGIFKRSVLASIPQQTPVAKRHKSNSTSAAPNSLTSRISKWLQPNWEYGGKPIVKSATPITLQGGEKGYLVRLATESIRDDQSYALARPKLQQARFFEELGLFRATNHSDTVTIQRKNKPIILVLEGGGSHQGEYYVSRQFISFKGWKTQKSYETVAESDNTGGFSCTDKGQCEVVKSTYHIISKSPLKISETTITQKGRSIDKIGKKVKRKKVIRIK